MLSKMRLWVRGIMVATIDVVLSVILVVLGAVMVIPEVLFIPLIRKLPRIAFYPKAKGAIKELQTEFDSVATGIRDITKKRGDKYFEELSELIKRIYDGVGSFDEIRFEVHAYKPEIDYKTDSLISTENRHYLILLNAGKVLKTEIIDGRLLELKLELDFMIRKRFAIAFVIVSFGILVLEIWRK